MIKLSYVFFLLILGLGYYIFTLRKRQSAKQKLQENMRGSSLDSSQSADDGGLPRSDRRMTIDRRKDRQRKENLTSHQKKIKKQAEDFVKSGNVLAAAQMLESIGLLREAIDTLERAGKIADAAKTLMRIGKHDRAGVMFAKHRRWDEAAECFHLAAMTVPYAKCLVEAGKYEKAGDVFAAEEMWEEAGDTFIRGGVYDKGANAYTKGQLKDKALNSLKKLASEPDARFFFSKAQFDLIEQAVKDGDLDQHLVKALASHSRLAQVIFYFLDQKNMTKALLIYQMDGSEGSAALLAQVNDRMDQGLLLAQLFERSMNFKQAGIMYSRLEKYSDAGQNFEKSKDWDRALTAYRQAGDEVKALEMEKLIPKSAPKIQEAPPPQMGSPKNHFGEQAQVRFSLQGAAEETVAFFVEPEKTIEDPLKPTGEFFSGLLKTPAFKNLPIQGIEELFAACKVNQYPDNSIILVDDRIHQGFYFLAKGEALSSASPQSIPAMTILNPGSGFFSKPSHQEFRAIGECTVFHLGQSQLDEFLEGHGKFCMLLYKNLGG
jgi:tetratricopeptide (TPR) repeat protein